MIPFGILPGIPVEFHPVIVLGNNWSNNSGNSYKEFLHKSRKKSPVIPLGIGGFNGDSSTQPQRFLQGLL